MNETEIVTLAVLLAGAVATDLRQGRIPNSLIVCGLLLGCAAGAWRAGWTGLGTSGAGALAGLAILLPFFALRLVGAGDAKLLAVVGAFTGPRALLPICLFTFLAGGVLAAWALCGDGKLATARHNLRTVLVGLGLWLQGMPTAPGDMGIRSAARLPYSVAIAAGVAVWLLIR